ncbi:hypothetical protein ACG0Z6_00225 [Roseateles sp. BYS180W]|uniref:DUF3108 domain-containing protein n=1 Tax=Roseateles rivi TaxID=3299028 RepID=A0ABW7FQU9_9BURK
MQPSRHSTGAASTPPREPQHPGLRTSQTAAKAAARQETQAPRRSSHRPRAQPPAQPHPHSAAVRLPLPAPQGELHYAYHYGATQGTAQLQWRLDAEGYVLQLQRQRPGRAPTASISQGQWGDQGLSPARHSRLRKEREHEVLWLDPEDGAEPQAPLPGGTQDALSWWWQLAGMVAGHPTPLRPGLRWQLPLAQRRGGVQWWTFELTDVDARHWRLQRVAAADGEAVALQFELLLDAQRGGLPLRLTLRQEGQLRWSLELLEGTSPP